MYFLIYSLVWLLTLVPLRVLYLLSDLLYPLVYYVFGYRKSVVRNNIHNSFPEKTKQEKLKIERQFYHFFCDLFVETMKEMHLSEKQIRRRMTYSNVEGILEQYAKGKSVMIMTAHYGNWEWTLGFPLAMPDGHSSNPIYKQQTSSDFDRLMYSLRAKFGADLIERKDLLRKMMRLKKEAELANFWMISDQTPTGSNPGIFFWMPFLNQDTATLTGTEQLAVKFDYPVFYASITRKKRGYYHCEFIPVELEPTKAEPYAITKKYMQCLEKNIQAAPQYWLWSHRRWKYQRNQA